MRNYTCEGMKDEDITIECIENRLKIIAERIKSCNKRNLTDINIICEEVFGHILNKLFGLNLISLSAEVSGNYVAVDLVDYDKKIAYQVTSNYHRNKIKDRIEKFNNNGLGKNIDRLKFLILDIAGHDYRGENEIELDNGHKVVFSRDIIDFKSLIERIKEKQLEDEKFIVELYDDINMVLDCGRLDGGRILLESEELKKTGMYDFEDNLSWEKGYGDVWISAFIPQNPYGKLGCLLCFRRSNLSGAMITLEETEILRDFFVPKDEFEKMHNIPRCDEDSEMYIQVGAVRCKVNVHTAYNMYKLFSEFKIKYDKEIERLHSILGTTGMEKKSYKYKLITINQEDLEKIIYFAENHDYFEDVGDEKWNIFNGGLKGTEICLSPYKKSKIQSDILTILHVNYNNKAEASIDIFWEPGAILSKGHKDMNDFNNVLKWKADYTKNWIQTELLPEAYRFWNDKNLKKDSIVKKKILQLMGRIKFRY